MGNCANCGTPLKPDAKFCGNCGAKQEDDAAQPPTISESPKKKSKKPVLIIAAVCAICAVIGGGWLIYSRLSLPGGTTGVSATANGGAGSVIKNADGGQTFLLPVGGDTSAALAWLKNNLFADDYYATANDGFSPILRESVPRAPLDGYTTGQTPGTGQSAGENTPDEESTPSDEPPPANEPSSAPDPDAPNQNLPIQSVTGWPTDYLPKGFPVYTGGDISAEAQPGQVIIIIDNATRDAYQKWLDTMKKAGYALNPLSSQNGVELGQAVKGNWNVMYEWDGTNTAVTIQAFYTN